MDPSLQKHLIDKLRIQMTQQRSSNRSPSSSNLKSPKSLPNIHKRSTTESLLKPEVISRDVSHRMDSLSKIKSTTQLQESKLKEILGMKPKTKALPQDLKSLEVFVSRKSKRIGHKKVFQELDNMKLKISKQKEKLLKKIVDEGGLLYRTQTGLLLPQLSGMYESLVKKINDSKVNLPRVELDLGNPSGRKEVEIIIGWLENMIFTYVNQPTDISLEEKVRRASMIYTACFKEVVRQVSSQCIERGILLQKIWNAQIDIYCAKEDEKIKKIEEIQKDFSLSLLEYKEKYKNKSKQLENHLKSAKELISEKETEISSLKSKIDEIKLQNEKDRHNLIMNFSKPKSKKHEKIPEDDFFLPSNRLENLKPKIPVVLIGYFDLNGSFHKKKAIQYIQGRRHENDVEDIIKIYEFSSVSIDTQDFSDYLKNSDFSVDKSFQFPESFTFKVSLESQISCKIAEKYSLKVYGKSRKSQKTYRLSVWKPIEKPRSTSVMVDKFNLLKPRSANISPSPSKPSRSGSINQSRRSSNNSSKSVRSSRKSSMNTSKNLDISNDIQIIEHKVLTPTDFRKNKIFKKLIEEKLNFINQENKERRKKSYFSNLSSRKSSINEVSSESDGSSSNNSSFLSQDESLNKGKKSELNVENSRSRAKSTILSPRTENIKVGNKKISRASFRHVVENENQRKSKYLKNINFGLPVNQVGSDGKIAAAPRYTIIKTPPLSSSDEEKDEERLKRKYEEGEPEKTQNNSTEKNKKKKNNPKKTPVKKTKKPEETLNLPKIEEKVIQNPETPQKPLETSRKSEKFHPDHIHLPSDPTLSQQFSEKSFQKHLSDSNLNSKPFPTHSKSNLGSSNQFSKISGKVTPKSSFSKDLSLTPSNSHKSQSFSGALPSKRVKFSIYNHLEQRVSEIDSNPLLKTLIFDKLKQAKDSKDLQEILKNLFPEDISPIPSLDLKEKSVQTDDLIDTLLTLEIPKSREKPRKSQNNLRRKSFSKTEISKIPPVMPSSSKSSQNTSGHLKTDKSRLKKTQSEEFTLGVINKKLVFTHPGQKLFDQIIENLKKGQKKQPKYGLKTLMKIISSVYQEKLSLPKENGLYYKSETSMVLYDLLMHKYGLKNVAEEHFVQVVLATLHFKDKVPRVFQFSLFLGCQELESFLEDWNFYAQVIGMIDSFSYGKSTAAEEAAHEHFLSLGVALQVVHSLFDFHVAGEKVEQILQQVIKIKIEGKQSVSKRTSDQKIVENVNLEEFFEICLDVYRKVREYIWERFWPDLGKDDFISEEEFLVFCKKFKFREPEPFSKIFEKYSVLQKIDEEKIQKVAKIRSLCALVFENSLQDQSSWLSLN